MVDLLEVNEQAEALSGDDIYIFIVHGLAPEFYTDIAFRKDKSCKFRMKDVICPFCGNVFDEVNAGVKIEVLRCPRNKAATFKFHQTKPCRICHRIVAIKYA